MKNFFLVSVCALFILLGTHSFAEAKSVSWSVGHSGDLYYYWDFSGRPFTLSGGGGWQRGLASPNISGSYTANIYNMSAGGLLLSDNASVPVGTQLRFTPKPVIDPDVSWIGTGYSADSPNGHWVEGAGAPSSVACLPQDYVGRSSYTSGGRTYDYDVYVPLNIDPPTMTVNHAGSAVLACDATGQNCTVNGAGTINTTFTFASTTGKFYYRYYDFRNEDTTDQASGQTLQWRPGCYGNSRALSTQTSRQEQYTYEECNPNPDCPPTGGPQMLPGLGEGFCDLPPVCEERTGTRTVYDYNTLSVNIPARTIPFVLTAVGPANQAPNPPIITGPTTGNPSQPYTFGFQATDPDNNTIRYGVDWDNNGSVDQWLPGSGYVASNTGQSSNYSWPTIGAKTFQAFTQDSNGAQSGWTTFTITLANAAPVVPTVDLKVNNSDGPITVPANSTLNMTWTVSNATSCTAEAYYGSPWGGAKSTTGGSESVAGTNTAQTYRLVCSGSGGSSVSDSVQVNIAAAPPAPIVDLKVNNSDGPITVPANSTLNMTWTVSNATSCTAEAYYGSPWGGAKSTTGGSESVAGTTTTQIYGLVCSGIGGTTRDEVQVNIAVAPPTPTADLRINSSNGPLNVSQGSSLALTWTTTNATSCTAWGAGWSAGGAVVTNGSANTNANQSDTYILQCTNGTTSATDSVQVSLSNSLKLCQNSCSSGVLRGSSSSTGSFTLARGGTQNLVACFNPAASCSDSSGNVTSSASWSEGGSNVVSLSGANPNRVTADNVGSEQVRATYSGQTASSNVTVTCVPTVSCSNAPGQENYCQNETFTVDNGCGTTITCNGTKTCNYNWKEVAP